MAGNRTQVNCLEGSYAYHYTTIATNPLEFGSQNGINVGKNIRETKLNRMKRGEEKNRRFAQSSVIHCSKKLKEHFFYQGMA